MKHSNCRCSCSRLPPSVSSPTPHPSQAPGSVFQPLWARHLSPSRRTVSFQALPKCGGFLESSQGIAILGRGPVGRVTVRGPSSSPSQAHCLPAKSSTSFCTNLATLTRGQAWGCCTTEDAGRGRCGGTFAPPAWGLRSEEGLIHLPPPSSSNLGSV